MERGFYPYTAYHSQAALTGIRPISTPVEQGGTIAETGFGREGRPFACGPRRDVQGGRLFTGLAQMKRGAHLRLQEQCT